MEPDETIEPLLADEDDDRTRQRAAGIGAVVGAVLGGRRGPLAAGVSAGVGGAVGYVVGDLLQREGDAAESATAEGDESITIDDGDDGPVEIDIDGADDETDDEATEEAAEPDENDDDGDD